MAEKYNGWTNYETWAVNLYMDNDRPQESFWKVVCLTCFHQAKADGQFTRQENASFHLAKRIQEEHENAATDMLEAAHYEFGPLADLLRGALSEVNWREIATSWIERYCGQEV